MNALLPTNGTEMGAVHKVGGVHKVGAVHKVGEVHKVGGGHCRVVCSAQSFSSE